MPPYVSYGVKYIGPVSLCAPASRFILPPFLCDELVSVPRRFLAYKYRKILEMLFKLRKLSEIMGLGGRSCRPGPPGRGGPSGWPTKRSSGSTFRTSCYTVGIRRRCWRRCSARCCLIRPPPSVTTRTSQTHPRRLWSRCPLPLLPAGSSPWTWTRVGTDSSDRLRRPRQHGRWHHWQTLIAVLTPTVDTPPQ